MHAPHCFVCMFACATDRNTTAEKSSFANQEMSKHAQPHDGETDSVSDLPCVARQRACIGCAAPHLRALAPLLSGIRTSVMYTLTALVIAEPPNNFQRHLLQWIDKSRSGAPRASKNLKKRTPEQRTSTSKCVVGVL